ncbi:MAG: hypothetical protein ACRCST_08110 [Turicibacter sp.]
MENNKFIIISTAFGDVDHDLFCEKVTLSGELEENDSQYMNKIQLTILKHDNKKNVFDLDIEGYQFHLFLGNFSDDKKNQILITGESGGSGGYAIARLYQVEGNQLKVLLDEESIAKQLTYQATYLKGGGARVICEETKKKYIIDIRKNFSNYLALVYDKQGNILPEITPDVSFPNTIYPILLPYKDYYSLQVQQRIIGVSNADTLGAIQTVIEVAKNHEINLEYQYLLEFGQEVK